ncbi:MAG TPA: hypothetical protein VN249_14000, partial [Prolixibacteraceae bacterium]|nr:hypothetical protein [Prolixibacteraceae bacterium]
MTPENHPIDQLFREKLGGFEQHPPAGLLDQINRQVAFRNRTRRINRIKSYIGIAAALLLISMAGWYTASQDQFSENKVPAVIQEEVTPLQQNVASAPDNSKAGNSQMLVSRQNPAKYAASGKVTTGVRQPVKKSSAKVAAPSSKNNVATSQPSPSSSEVASNTAVIPQNPADAKEVTTPDAGSGKSQKKGETRYFANSQFNPAASKSKEVKTGWALKAEV